MRSIFISYRREDAEGQAGRLFDDLVAHFGRDSVFMDVVDIEPGRDFRRVIDEHVASCGVLLALIGRGWISATDQAGRRRLDNPNDFVRLETAAALRRDIPVIPVLVQGARMPESELLPEDLKDLAFRNAVELTHARWDSDIQVLIKALGRHAGAEEQQPARANLEVGSDAAPAIVGTRGVRGTGGEPGARDIGPTVAPQPRKRSWRAILITSVVAIAVLLGGYRMYLNIQKAAEEQRIAAEHAAEEQRAAAERAAAEKAAQERAARERAAQEQTAKDAAQKAEKDKAELAAQRARDAEARADKAAAEQAKREAERTPSGGPPSPSSFRVIEVLVRADPIDYKGRCPGKINFIAKVSAVGGPGRVSYRWLRGDGVSSPVRSLVFDAPGSKEVNISWSLGNPGRQYSAWGALKIEEPQEIESKKAAFRVQCDPPVSADIAAVKILSVSCTGIGSDLYKVEMHGEAAGPSAAYFSVAASPYVASKSAFTTTCTQWTLLTGPFPRCQRQGSQPFKMTWKSTQTLYASNNRAPSSASAQVYEDAAGSANASRLLVKDTVRMTCN